MFKLAENQDITYLNTKAQFLLSAEQGTLGAIILDESHIHEVMGILKPEHFYQKIHREIYSCMISMSALGKSIDHITILNEVIKAHIFESDIDAKEYIYKLGDAVDKTKNASDYANIVLEKYHMRVLTETARDIIELANNNDDDAEGLLDYAEQKIFDIRQGKDIKGLRPIKEVLIETYDRLQKLSSEDSDKYRGLRSGFSYLDTVLTGLNKSDLIVLAARPGMGKTAFILNIAQNVATKQKKTVAIFSLEMPSDQLVTRMLASLTLVDSYSFKTGKMNTDDWGKIATASELLSQSPIYMDDTANMTVNEMKSKLRRVKNLGLVVIDYLQLMSSNMRTNNRVQEVSEITRNLKIMAKELDVPVIVCSQLARGPDARTDHRPLLSDLRESGSIEQDADSVLFLYRDAYYNKEAADASIAECIVAKNRHGETATVPLTWDGKHTRFISREIVRDEPQN